ncbi:T22D2 protein, partial [Ramphastos sulfuratus]|nr:T22D2 protein [Ramphastos sulfuratus]
MSRKRSGFAITSVRGGSGAGGGNGNASNGSGSGAASPVTSRFRLVRLTAEPLRRGRWVCRDYYERDSGCRAGRGCGRLPASLDSPQAPLPGSASASGSPPAA